MEALRNLERVQTMLSFMQTRGLSSNHQDSDRFLAHFLLFMVQPFSTLNMEKRRDLINEHLSKISATILGDALLCITEEGCQQIYDENPSQCYLENKSGLHLLEAKVDDMAKIGFDAMQRANSTLEDFCRSYFMFHGIDANKPHTIFKFLPMLSFVESYIYQLDIMNEKDLHASSMDTITSKSCPNKLNYICKEAANQNETEILHESSRVDLFNPLFRLLQCHELLTDRIRTELKFGAEYWMLERKLCHALTSKRKILIEDVMRAIHLKSFDYRVLNLLLYQLRGQQVNEIHMEFLSISEFLVEVSDDLFHYAQSMTSHQRSCRYDYEDDVMENSFNVLRMFVGVYGVSVAPSMLAKCISEAEEKYERLSRSLDPDLSLNYRRRCEEATKEGGMTSGHAYGTWNIPHVIADEESFRSQSIEPKQSKRTS